MHITNHSVSRSSWFNTKGDKRDDWNFVYSNVLFISLQQQIYFWPLWNETVCHFVYILLITFSMNKSCIVFYSQVVSVHYFLFRMLCSRDLCWVQIFQILERYDECANRQFLCAFKGYWFQQHFYTEAFSASSRWIFSTRGHFVTRRTLITKN